MQQPEVTITVRVPADLVRQVRAAAEINDETLSQVVRRALRDYVGRSRDPQLELQEMVRQ